MISASDLVCCILKEKKKAFFLNSGVKLRKEIEFAFSGFCLFVCLFRYCFFCKPLFGCGENKGKIKSF